MKGAPPNRTRPSQLPAQINDPSTSSLPHDPGFLSGNDTEKLVQLQKPLRRIPAEQQLAKQVVDEQKEHPTPPWQMGTEIAATTSNKNAGCWRKR
jgi:hypothetical protein